MHGTRATKILGGALGTVFVGVVLIRALFDAYGHVGSFLAFLPASIGKFISSPNGTVFLIVVGLFLLWWAFRQQSIAEQPSHELAFEALRRRDDERKIENEQLRDQIAALVQERPRRLTDEQSRQIAERLNAWPAYSQQRHLRRVLILASPKAPDAINFARQLRMALEAGGIFSDDVEDFTWGDELQHTPEHREANDMFLALHDRNVTVVGSDTDLHDGEPVDAVIVGALRAAGIDVTAHPAPNQIGGQVAIVVGTGSLPEAVRRSYELLHTEIEALRPRRLTADERRAISAKLAPLAEEGGSRSLHVLAGSGFDCGDYARDFQEVFEAAGFRIDTYSPGMHRGDDFHYGVWVRWDPEWRAQYSFPKDGPVIAEALHAAGIDVTLIERAGTFTSLIVGSRSSLNASH